MTAEAPLILAFDTTDRDGCVSLSRGETLLGEALLDGSATPSERVLQAAQQLLQQAQCALPQLDALAVVRGPGSFTGVRVGLGTVQGLALALDKPVLALSSLEVLAQNARGHVGLVWAVVDARKQEVYAASYRGDGQRLQPLGAELVLRPESLLAQMTEPALVLGTGVALYRELFATQPHLTLADAVHDRPRLSQALPLLVTMFSAGRGLAPCALRPVYLRASEAEVAREQRLRQMTGGG